MVEDASEMREKVGDWSLRADGGKYRNQRDESNKLILRIRNSTASVTGISGERGAGKSSLAQRVLGELKTNDEAFTALIHSPTGYDSRDFLVSLFQRVCEDVVADIDQWLTKGDPLSKHVNSERFQLIHKSIGLSLVVLLVVLLVLSMPLQLLSPADYVEYWHNLFKFSYPFIYKYIPHALGFFFLYWFLFVWKYSISRGIGRRLLHYIAYRREYLRRVALRNQALEHSEHLKFQTTFSMSTDASLSLLNFRSKFTGGKSLSARPLSLPSLTEQFAQFLRMVSEVYKGKVVICLDELDKIQDKKDLNNLLRCIKGILGQRGTHFLLTVSEDALAEYTTRRRRDRGMLESAFEDIILLDRVDLELADHIVDLMYSASSHREDKEGPIHTSTILLWLFGNAIPREIKRNALVCLEEGCPPKAKESPPQQIWELLFEAHMDNMTSWASRFGDDNQITEQFLSMLQKSIIRDDGSSNKYDLEWGRRIVALWKKPLDTLIATENQAAIKLPASSNVPNHVAFALTFGQEIIEILLGVTALVYVLNPTQELSKRSIEILYKVFKFTPTNRIFAGKMMKKYIDDLELLVSDENSGK